MKGTVVGLLDIALKGLALNGDKCVQTRRFVALGHYLHDLYYCGGLGRGSRGPLGWTMTEYQCRKDARQASTMFVLLRACSIAAF